MIVAVTCKTPEKAAVVAQMVKIGHRVVCAGAKAQGLIEAQGLPIKLRGHRGIFVVGRN